ncbi:hypothetical protein [Agromyces bauzanensis]
MRPHTVGADGIRVRHGLGVDLAFGWEDIASVEHRMQDETDIEIELERPTVVRLPGGGANGGEQIVTGVRIWVDDPRAFMDEVRKHL